MLEALGGAKERIRATTAAGFDLAGIAELNVVGVEVKAAPGARSHRLRAGTRRRSVRA